LALGGDAEVEDVVGGVVVEAVEVVDEAFEGVGGDHSVVPRLIRFAAYAVLIIPAATSATATILRPVVEA